MIKINFLVELLSNRGFKVNKRFTEEQVIRAIKSHEAGCTVEDICRELGIAHGTFYNLRSKYAGLEVN